MATQAMATRKGAARGGMIPAAWISAARRAVRVGGGALLVLLALGGAVALLGYNAGDPSLSTASGRVPQNPLGSVGAAFADAALMLFGYAAALLLPALAVAGVRLVSGRGVARARSMAPLTALAVLAAAVALGVFVGAPGLPAGAGGMTGLLAAKGLGALPLIGSVALAGPIAAVFAVTALILAVWGSGIELRDFGGIGALFRRRETAEPTAPRLRKPRPQPLVEVAEPELAAPRANIVTNGRSAPAPSKRAAKDRQPSLDLRDRYQLPSLSLLKPPPKGPTVKIDAASLEQNARLLESVLDDFGVKGRIGEVRPGPVVTMYELEPAPGIKASRVIGLADDIARSMCALSARVAVVAGRNVIGIELPNQRREMVALAELINSAAFDDSSQTLPLVLGKNIAGDPVIADLSPMPHLLIAGTTGSGKSVGLNCMILSLLYRLNPDQCKMIMIDPKMLELSIYDRIPHLLAPVVTDPPKAIRALKWAVEEMEDRYRKMSTVNVRSLSGFNARVVEARATGKPFVRKVHTGYDDDGQAIYEEEQLDLETLPLIVVVVDELADLMALGRRDHRRHQGEPADADQLSGDVKDRFADDPGRAGCRATARQGRHALHAGRQAGGARPWPLRQR